MAFAAVGAEVMRAASVPLLDGWALTSGQADRGVSLHYDALYVGDEPHAPTRAADAGGEAAAAMAPAEAWRAGGAISREIAGEIAGEAWRAGGAVSREIANLFLNTACNRRLLHEPVRMQL